MSADNKDRPRPHGTEEFRVTFARTGWTRTQTRLFQTRWGLKKWCKRFTADDAYKWGNGNPNIIAIERRDVGPWETATIDGGDT